MAKRLSKKDQALAAVFDKCERCGAYHCTVMPYALVAERPGCHVTVSVNLCRACNDGLFLENEHGEHYPEFIRREKIVGVGGSPAFPSEEIGYTYKR